MWRVGVQGMAVAEAVILRVASAVGKLPEEIRELNLIKEGACRRVRWRHRWQTGAHHE